MEMVAEQSRVPDIETNLVFVGVVKLPTRNEKKRQDTSSDPATIPI